MQFTTNGCDVKRVFKLLSIKQRYKLNAIHNRIYTTYISIPTVVNKAKIQIECNSQRLQFAYVSA